MYYKQCVLRKDKWTTISWIPEKFAKKNKVVKIKSDTGWETGWIVKEIYHLKKTEEAVLRDKDAYLHQRKVSDI